VTTIITTIITIITIITVSAATFIAHFVIDLYA